MFYPKLIFNLDNCPKTKRINLWLCKISGEALEKKMVSSANCKIDTLVLSLPTIFFFFFFFDRKQQRDILIEKLSLPTMNPSNKPLSSSLVIILLRTSITMVKRKGERGSPYLNPLMALTQPLAFPLTRTTQLVEDKHPLTQDLHFMLTPFFSSTWS